MAFAFEKLLVYQKAIAFAWLRVSGFDLSREIGRTKGRTLMSKKPRF